MGNVIEKIIFPEVSENCADDSRNNYFNEIDYYYSEVKFHLGLFETSIKQFNLRIAKNELEDELIPSCIEFEIILRALRDKLNESEIL